mmetsp:Transcript_8748/g.12709  ORF Transcript_8748/g.12709 Transcript_8748/m.12709 type:complete len:182 (+) Transcript_8748:80-625(+)
MNDKEEITLKIVGLGHKLTLTIPSSATIETLKQKIESLTLLPVSYQRLLARGHSFNNDNTDDNVTTLSDAGIEDRTKIMLLHNASYAADKAGVDCINELVEEINALEQKLTTTTTTSKKKKVSKQTVHELVTQICCKLDGVDTNGSDSLRAMRKRAIQKAEGLDSGYSCQQEEEEEEGGGE